MRSSLLAASCCVVLLLLACGGPAARPTKPRTRDELKTLLSHKSKDEVLKLLGKPARTYPVMDSEAWVYERVSRDPVADKVDRRTTVYFKNGVVDYLSP